MKAFILAGVLSVLASASLAQSWTAKGGRAVAPQSIAGDRSGGFEILCDRGNWVMYEFAAYAPNGVNAPVRLEIDGVRYQAHFDFFGDGDEGIALSPQIIAAMKAGRTVKVQYASGTAGIDTTYTLRGSSKALGQIGARCR